MKIGRCISLSYVVLSTVLNVFATNVEAAHASPGKVFNFESIKGLGSCRSELSIRAEHRDGSGVTLWLSVRGASARTCSLTMSKEALRFENYSLSGVNFTAAHRFKKRVTLKSNSLVIPKQFMAPGRVIAVRLTFRKLERGLISPLISDSSESGSCIPLVRQVRIAEMEVRGCTKDSDCSRETIPFGCGCHFEKPLKDGAYTEVFYSALALATKAGCSVEEVTSCECRKVSDVTCRMGVCDWR